ncbi:MAG: glucose-6-phosphate dehydrogenase, partial [Polyangiaceae bacterium]|nr:glucose-6-phosphate dehydrogenase [Polyangiaceae bacterium]
IFPALFELVARGKLEVPIIGMARRGWQLSDLVARAKASIQENGQYDEATFEKFSGLLRYVDGDYQDEATFASLKSALGDARHALHYLAIPPSMFAPVVGLLGKTGVAEGARLVVEKPFGRDLESARELNHTIHSIFGENRLFRIDHYLGKSAVQNLLAFRFGNIFFEPIWNSHYIESVQVTLSEDFGVEGRGKFYEEVGAIRDVIQNHALQIVSYLAMEPPVGTYPEALRDEQVKVLRMIRSIRPDDAVRGQVRDYRSEPGVDPDSQVETFAALRLHLDSWRWEGVPFLIRAGKDLPISAAEIFVRFKRPPLSHDVAGLGNHIRLRLSPEVEIALATNVNDESRSGLVQRELVAETLDLHSQTNPYARLLGDALVGDQTLFTREDGVEEAWRIVDDLLAEPPPVIRYEAGTWGPGEASRLAALHGGWHDPTAETD